MLPVKVLNGQVFPSHEYPQEDQTTSKKSSNQAATLAAIGYSLTLCVKLKQC